MLWAWGSTVHLSRCRMNLVYLVVARKQEKQQQGSGAQYPLPGQSSPVISLLPTRLYLLKVSPPPSFTMDWELNLQHVGLWGIFKLQTRAFPSLPERQKTSHKKTAPPPTSLSSPLLPLLPWVSGMRLVG